MTLFELKNRFQYKSKANLLLNLLDDYHVGLYGASRKDSITGLSKYCLPILRKSAAPRA